MTLAKICGLSTPEAVKAALDGGAAYLGFVFFDKSPRCVTPELAARLAEPARGRAKIVAVVVDPDDEAVDRIAGILRPNLFQLHGKETPQRATGIIARAETAVIKAFPISEPSDLDAARPFEDVALHQMFDAKTPEGSANPGGMGAKFDWTMLKGRRMSRPWFLAGGLDPWNVAEAVSQSGAPMVDVSSGVERGPGLKDPALISAFLDAVRRA